MYEQFELIVTLPCAGFEAFAQVRADPSTSVPARAPEYDESSERVILAAVAVGASFTGDTVIVTLEFAETVNESFAR